MTLFRSLLTALALWLPVVAAAQSSSRLGVSGVGVSRSEGEKITMSMTVEPRLVSLGRDQLVRITPVMRSLDGERQATFTPYAFAGKNQYFYTIRGHEGPGETYRAGQGVPVAYTSSVAWEDWMDNATIDFVVTTSTCCGEPVGEESVPVVSLCYAEPPVVNELEYVQPVPVETKEFTLEGRAYVNFPVNRTEIFPDYMNNPAELRKITASIDTVRDNRDATIESITLTGYASPEGPYANNVRLAKGRTEAVRYYVERLYDFPSSTFRSNSVPEDWAGLREAIVKSDLPMRDKMLSFIDSEYPVETRNDKFREMFPNDYKWLLGNVYPWLRHTDYLIKYTIRKYNDVEEIKRVMAERPQNLSLDEFYLVAQSYPVGSEQYNRVFDIAVRMFPDDPVANLNAANAALNRDDLDSAERYLRKAGDSPEAAYARGILYADRKDYDKALQWLGRADTPKAREAMERVKAAKARKAGATILIGADSEVKLKN